MSWILAAIRRDRHWAVSIEAELKAHASDRRNADYRYRSAVFRVPSSIKALKPQMYQHQVLSLGLYDRDFVNMAPIDKLRLEVVSEFLEQIKEMPDSAVRSWDDLCQCVAGPVEEAEELRHFYHFGPGESPIDIESTTARSVLTFDAVFLTVFLFVWTSNFGTPLLNCGRFLDIFLQKGLARNLQEELYYDMLLFENQIPLALVRQVWNQMSVDKTDPRFNTHIRHTLLQALYSHRPSWAYVPSDYHISFVECSHLLHCLYIVVCNSNTPGPASDSAAQYQFPLGTARRVSSIWGRAAAYWSFLGSRWAERKFKRRRRERSLPTATELHKAGVKFRGSGKDTSVSEIRLEKSTFRATLYLPQIDIHDSTERVLRNLVAFEMMHSGNDYKLRSYLLVMDYLINTGEDVRLLMKGKNPVIGINNIGSENDIAELFNRLNQYVTIDTSATYTRLMKEVDDWCTQKTRQHVIRFVDRFIDRPWTSVSLVAATLLLVMTALQTFYTVKGFYQQT